jgi:geranylgeranyl diphosphate synthase type II
MKMLLEFKDEVEEALQSAFSGDTLLGEAISAALLSEGKRIRPILVHLVSDALGYKMPVMPAALASEYFHTASLIADDLPCMDNDDFRRDKPSLHKLYGERVALLASYALISEGFLQIEKNGALMRNTHLKEQAFEATTIALASASNSCGIRGAVLGQFYDLERSSTTLLELEEVIYLKTIVLFEGAFILGWLFGGGEFNKLEAVKRLAKHFGMAFQIRDDLLDFGQDKKRESAANFAITLGKEEAFSRLNSEVNAFLELLQELNLLTPAFKEIADRLRSLI